MMWWLLLHLPLLLIWELLAINYKYIYLYATSGSCSVILGLRMEEEIKRGKQLDDGSVI